jgi:hypothetical protein
MKQTKSSTTKMAKLVFQPGPPKRTRQGQGRNSLPKKGRKAYRGQGR